MKNKCTQTAVGTILGILILIVGAQISVSAQGNEKSEQNKRNLVGTWQTSVTPRNCQTGDPVAEPFPGILTFSQGGTLTGTAIAVGSVGGVWEKTHGWRNYSFAFISLRYSPTGGFLGTQKVRQTTIIGVNGDEFTTTGSFEVLDANGNVVGTGCSTSTGTRFE